MPGVHLNDVEGRLAKAWQSDTRFGQALTSISISGAAGLRGLQDVTLEFDYPVTVISGRNGAGKSTLLALAMLAFSDPARKSGAGSSKKPRGKHSRAQRQNYQDFVFSDFFFKGPTDSDVSGIDIHWAYADGASLTVHKQSNKWMRYERRPKKRVTYLGISRCVPAIEQRTLRSKFGGSRQLVPTTNLNEAYVRRLSNIMGAEFVNAEVYGDERYGLRALQNRARYSGFNMGAGEDAVVQILHALQEAQPGSIIGIEEIELGIHPSALRQLAQHIIQVSKDKGLQVVITSHSEHFIDQVPRQARVLLQRAGRSAFVYPGPTTRMALTALSNVKNAEYTIFVEDAIAEQIVGTLLEHDLRRRVEVKAIGSKSGFSRIAQFVESTEPGRGYLLLFDGDVTDSELRKFFLDWGKTPPMELTNGTRRGFEIHAVPDSTRIFVGRLPGQEPPERWLLRAVLDDVAAVGHFAGSIGPTFDTDEARAVIEEVCTMKDVHSLLYELAERLQISGNICCDHVVRALVQAQPSLAVEFSNRIRSLLGGELAN